MGRFSALAVLGLPVGCRAKAAQVLGMLQVTLSFEDERGYAASDREPRQRSWGAAPKRRGLPDPDRPGRAGSHDRPASTKADLGEPGCNGLVIGSSALRAPAPGAESGRWFCLIRSVTVRTVSDSTTANAGPAHSHRGLASSMTTTPPATADHASKARRVLGRRRVYRSHTSQGAATTSIGSTAEVTPTHTPNRLIVAAKAGAASTAGSAKTRCPVTVLLRRQPVIKRPACPRSPLGTAGVPRRVAPRLASTSTSSKCTHPAASRYYAGARMLDTVHLASFQGRKIRFTQEKVRENAVV